mmetsp:Transcript_9812/g.29510  ORF Transcript_9812/g.29510 Transcript_9812/m.29510 type:complete len:125 (-) Transcript_9812:153-527(-)
MLTSELEASCCRIKKLHAPRTNASALDTNSMMHTFTTPFDRSRLRPSTTRTTTSTPRSPPSSRYPLKDRGRALFDDDSEDQATARSGRAAPRTTRHDEPADMRGMLAEISEKLRDTLQFKMKQV